MVIGPCDLWRLKRRGRHTDRLQIPTRHHGLPVILDFAAQHFAIDTDRRPWLQLGRRFRAFAQHLAGDVGPNPTFVSPGAIRLPDNHREILYARRWLRVWTVCWLLSRVQAERSRVAGSAHSCETAMASSMSCLLLWSQNKALWFRRAMSGRCVRS